MIRVQSTNFDQHAEYRALLDDSHQTGAVVTFVGLVRDMNAGQQVSRLELEHYEGMTENVLSELVAECEQRWRLLNVRIIHRVGELLPGDQIVFIGVSSAHRGDAFAACEYLIDALKTRAPLWKKETYPDAQSWLDDRASDRQKMAAWGEQVETG